MNYEPGRTPYDFELIRTNELTKDTPTYFFYNKLHEEAGEVAEVASAFMGSQKKIKKLSDKHGCLEEAMLDELGDTFNVVMILAGRHNITVDEVIERGRIKLKRKNDKRDPKVELCSTCDEPYSQPPSLMAMTCSNGFHCCRDCSWEQASGKKGRRTKLCDYCKEEDRKFSERATKEWKAKVI